MKRHEWKPGRRNRTPVMVCTDPACPVVWWPDRDEPMGSCPCPPHPPSPHNDRAALRGQLEEYQITVEEARELVAEWTNPEHVEFANLYRSVPGSFAADLAARLDALADAVANIPALPSHLVLS